MSERGNEPRTDDAVPAGPDAALAEELEELRALFQRELDRAKDGLPDDETAVPTPPETAPDRPVCACCGEPPSEDDAQTTAPYCARCRDALCARPIHPAASLCVLVTLLLAVLGLYFFTDAAPTWRQAFAAQQAVQDRRLTDAADRYGDCVLTKSAHGGVSLTVLKRYADLCLTLGDGETAALVVESEFPKVALRLPWNARYRDLPAMQARFAATEEAAIAIFEDYEDATDPAAYEAADARLCALRTDDAYAPVAVEYIRYLLMKAAEKPAQAQMAQLERIRAADDGHHAQYYLYGMIELAGQTGDSDTARACFEAATARNVQDLRAYEAYVRALRMQKAPDAAAIFSVAQAAQVNAPANAAPVWLRLFAVGDLLRGDNEQALQTMGQYVRLCYEQQLSLTLEDWNLYALCTIAAGDTESYEQIRTVLGDAKLPLSSLIAQVQSGVLTVTQALQADGGEIA